jgi:hypothetical protein
MRGYGEDAVNSMAKDMAKRHTDASLFVPAEDHMLIDHREDPQYKTQDKWIVKHHEQRVNQHGMVVQKSTFSSPVIRLKTGEAHFTINQLFHCPFPKGDYQILHHEYRMVRENADELVDLGEVYPHHWLIGGNAPLDECQRDFFWGGGAEFHNMSYTVAEGYAFKRINSQGWCGANFHFLRTEDLKVHWDGFNDPMGSHGAAVKNCIECGYAPNRAIECTEGGDGGFECCFTLSRCPVNNRSDIVAKGYRFQYDVEWSEDLSQLKPVKMVMLDNRGDTEGNIFPGQISPETHTICDDKLCITNRTWTVGKQGKLGDGICSGTMLWSFLHQHIGAVNGSMWVNGQQHCAGYPNIGTDPSNPYGNEKGYIVSFSECVNSTNQVRLNAGDLVTILDYYDVDVNSTRNLPIPNGKHGGVMGLYFGQMDCDEGSFGEVYVCRNSACVPTYEENLATTQTWYATADDCRGSCK